MAESLIPLTLDMFDNTPCAAIGVFVIDAVIFDFDGVLVESVDIKTKAFEKLFESNGLEIAKKVRDYHIQNAGVSRFDKFYYIYAHILKQNLTESVFQNLCHRFAKIVVDAVVDAPYVNGAKEILDKYAERYSFFVCSATPEEELKEIIRRRQIAHCFKDIYGSPKKKPIIVKEILETYRLKPNNVFYIGDALSDYEAARSCGVTFVARVSQSDPIFASVKCIKIKDLTAINNILESNR